MRSLVSLKSITTTIGASALLALSSDGHANTSLSNYPSQVPLFTSTSSTPLNMLVLGRDHKLYFEAYNDASDLNGDGVIDIGYKGHLSASEGGIDYFGYFNSKVCYQYNSSDGGYFEPKVAAGDNKECSTPDHWSGDYLNYLTTSRMDALRKVLYGGFRKTDTTTVGTTTTYKTILEGAYIPQDAHTWGKEYTSEAVDGYKISDYAGLSAPSPTSTRHLFSVTSRNKDEAPRLQYISNSSYRIWNWISKERGSYGVAGDRCNAGSGEVACPSAYLYIRVEACPSNADLREDNCKNYPSGSIKPTGVLHDFGETERMHFGLLTGSYEKNISGGILRANMASFAREVDPSTGQFCTNDDACKDTKQITNPIRKGIVHNINKLKVYGFQHNTGSSNEIFSWTTCPWIPHREMSQNDKCHMWGNPIGEMMYETLRYYAGAEKPTSYYNYENAKSVDNTLELSKPDWKAPYTDKNYSCSVPAMTVISDINPSFDSQIPGTHWTAEGTSSFINPANLSSFNVSTETDAIGVAEKIHTNNYFIGSANGIYDGAPSSKKINNLASVRGLAPEEPTRQGTFYSAGVSRFAANNVIGGGRKLHTYAVALASPLPEIKFKINNNEITLVPFAKTVSGGFSNYNINTSSEFRPTNSIADFYIENIANTDPKGSDKKENINNGLPYMQFRINFEDQEQGADFDMDALAIYTIRQSSDKTLEVNVKIEQDGGSSWVQNIGYIISGTGTLTDGTYLEICSSSESKCNSNDSIFKLNTPPGENPGSCIGKPSDTTCRLPRKFNETVDKKTVDVGATRTFDLSNTNNASLLLKSPLWYAAKYGIPDRKPESVIGDPDNYFLVTNAINLKSQLTKAFDNFKQANNSVTSPAVSLPGNEIEDGLNIYRTDYQARTWSGDLIKEELDVATGERTIKWKASSALRSSSRNIKTSNANSDALIDLTWDNLLKREEKNNAGNTVNIYSSLAQDHKNTKNFILPAVDANGKLSTTDTKIGQDRLAFIKGAVDLKIRHRDSILGDIINSNPVVVGGATYLAYLANRLEPSGNYTAFSETHKNRAKHIYVGANDGMLHAFSDQGVETFAFVPSAVLPELHHLAKSTYNEQGGDHKYYVDGSPVVRDVFINNQWKTVLIGTLGAGGRSIFALDITLPTSVELLWEFNVGDDIPANAPSNTPSDMGYSFPTPTVAKLHSGQWAVVTGNGYDSPSGRSVLMLIDIATGSMIKKIPTATQDTLNGLATVRVADNNSDGIADYAYAGDLKGNLWRFDLLDSSRAQPLTRTDIKVPENDKKVTPDAYKVSFGGKPLFATQKPITAPPSLIRHPTLKGYLVLFGTGRYFREDDKSAAEKAVRQTIYGVWDQYTTGQPTNTVDPKITLADLQRQTITTGTTSYLVDGKTFTLNVRTLSSNPVTWRTPTNASGKMGWHLDLGETTPDGERLVNSMAVRGQVLLAGTVVPTQVDCEPGFQGWMYGINPYTGGHTTFAVFDLNQDGKLDSADLFSGFKIPAGGFTLSSDRIFTTDGDSRKINFGPAFHGRQTWQVIPEDE